MKNINIDILLFFGIISLFNRYLLNVFYILYFVFSFRRFRGFRIKLGISIRLKVLLKGFF